MLYYQRQFTWRLYSIVMIPARLVTASFMHWHASVSIRLLSTSCAGVFALLLTGSLAYNGEMLFWMVLLSAARIPPSRVPILDEKLNEAAIFLCYIITWLFRVRTQPKTMDVKGDKNPQDDLFWRGEKAVGPMS
jgi:hypothetical protein